MLAQNLKSPKQLRITNAKFEALLKTLKLFETKEIKWVDVEKHVEIFEIEPNREFTGKFNMHEWGTNFNNCGTIACIGGTAEMIGGVKFGESLTDGLYKLFYPHEVRDWNRIKIPQAAQALRNYLTHGSPMWETIFSSRQLEPHFRN